MRYPWPVMETVRPFYRMPLYRPPSEAASLLIQATYGCPHNACTFCGMYKESRFRARPLADVLADIDAAGGLFGDRVRTIFLPDGNTIALATRKLLLILERIAHRFPHVQRVTCYGAAKYVIRKSLQELQELCAAGLKRLHMGMESGDRETLEHVKKGTTPEEIIEAGCRVREAGMEISEYYLVGLGGRERLEPHARASAQVLNAIAPHYVRLRTLIPVPGTPLFTEIAEGRFELPGPRECLRELRFLVADLACETRLLSDHISNFVKLNGCLPRAKEKLVQQLDACLEMDEASFGERPPWWSL
ncbi:MAG: radical SAM protein [Planctomycetota bacterium]